VTKRKLTVIIAVSRKDKSLGDIKRISFRLNFMFGGENMAWIYLIIAGIFEVVWATGLKYSHGLQSFFLH
jgi:hypothetical protein